MQPYAIYQEDMRTEYEQKNLALLNLEKALEQEEFVVCYQPVVEGKQDRLYRQKHWFVGTVQAKSR